MDPRADSSSSEVQTLIPLDGLKLEDLSIGNQFHYLSSYGKLVLENQSLRAELSETRLKNLECAQKNFEHSQAETKLASEKETIKNKLKKHSLIISKQRGTIARIQNAHKNLPSLNEQKRKMVQLETQLKRYKLRIRRAKRDIKSFQISFDSKMSKLRNKIRSKSDWVPHTQLYELQKTVDFNMLEINYKLKGEKVMSSDLEDDTEEEKDDAEMEEDE